MGCGARGSSSGSLPDSLLLTGTASSRVALNAAPTAVAPAQAAPAGRTARPRWAGPTTSLVPPLQTLFRHHARPTTQSWPASAVSSRQQVGHCLACLLRLMCALGSLSQELKDSHWPSLGPSCKGSLPCRASLLKQLGLCPQAGAGGGGEDPGYERPRGTAFVNAGGSSPRREARPKRAAAEAAVSAPGTKPQVSNSEWTIARKLFYVQGKQVTTASDALGGWRSSLWPVGGGRPWQGGLLCAPRCVHRCGSLGCEACCFRFGAQWHNGQASLRLPAEPLRQHAPASQLMSGVVDMQQLRPPVWPQSQGLLKNCCCCRGLSCPCGAISTQPEHARALLSPWR